MPTIIELTTEVRDMLNEAVPATWTDMKLRKWLNEANRDIARVTHHYKSTSSVTMIAGTQDYTLNSAIIAVEQGWYNDGSRFIPLVARHIESMDQVWGGLQTQPGTPAFFMTLGYSPQLKLRLFPVPTSSTHTVSLITAVLPTALPLTGSDTTNVDVPLAWYDLLADYCTFKGLQMDRDPRWQEFRRIYLEKRDDMVTLGDYSNVNREVVPDPVAGYLPRWLVEFEDW